MPLNWIESAEPAYRLDLTLYFDIMGRSHCLPNVLTGYRTKTLMFFVVCPRYFRRFLLNADGAALDNGCSGDNAEGGAGLAVEPVW